MALAAPHRKPAVARAAGAAPDATVIVGDEAAAFAGCAASIEIITSIVNPIYGNDAAGCNATDSYRCAPTIALAAHGCAQACPAEQTPVAPWRSIVAAACLGTSECVIRASADVFTNACPTGTGRTLSFGYS